MTDQVKIEDCGQCRVHSDCIERFNTTEAFCVSKMKGTEPDNYCAVSCEIPSYKNETHYGECKYDESLCETVWKCHHGYEGNCTVYTKSCEDRCLNGGQIDCKDDEPCPCPDEFVGEFCHIPSPCHEGTKPKAKKVITLFFFSGYCDPETKTCEKDSEGKPICVWKDGYNSSLKTVTSSVLLLVQALLLTF